MSWSFSVRGTRKAALRQLAAQTTPTGSAQETACFERVRAQFAQLIEELPPTVAWTSTVERVALVKCDAAGHGACCNAFSFATEYVEIG